MHYDDVTPFYEHKNEQSRAFLPINSAGIGLWKRCYPDRKRAWTSQRTTGSSGSSSSGEDGAAMRDRFANYFIPTLSHEPRPTVEDFPVTQKMKQIGPHWAQIAGRLPVRSSNAVKNGLRTQLRATYRGRSAKRAAAARVEPPTPPEAEQVPMRGRVDIARAHPLDDPQPGRVNPACRSESLALVPNVQQFDIELRSGTVRPA
jgi:hypothetical protein